MQLWMRCSAISLMMILSVAPVHSESNLNQLSGGVKNCGVRIQWNFDKELRCQMQFNEAKTTAFCSHILFIEGEYQCVITTRPKLTHSTLGEAVRSCLLQLPENCRQ